VFFPSFTFALFFVGGGGASTSVPDSDSVAAGLVDFNLDFVDGSTGFVFSLELIVDVAWVAPASFVAENLAAALEKARCWDEVLVDFIGFIILVFLRLGIRIFTFVLIVL